MHRTQKQTFAVTFNPKKVNKKLCLTIKLLFWCFIEKTLIHSRADLSLDTLRWWNGAPTPWELHGKHLEYIYKTNSRPPCFSKTVKKKKNLWNGIRLFMWKCFGSLRPSEAMDYSINRRLQLFNFDYLFLSCIFYNATFFAMLNKYHLGVYCSFWGWQTKIKINR